MRHSFAEIGVHAAAPGFMGVLLKGIVAGWLIALMVWLLPAAGSAKILVIVAVTYIVAISDLSHVIAGSVDTAFAAAVGEIGWGDYALGFLLPALSATPLAA